MWSGPVSGRPQRGLPGCFLSGRQAGSTGAPQGVAQSGPERFPLPLGPALGASGANLRSHAMAITLMVEELPIGMNYLRDEAPVRRIRWRRSSRLRIDDEPFSLVVQIVLFGRREARIGHPLGHLLLGHVHLALLGSPVSALYNRNSAFCLDVSR